MIESGGETSKHEGLSCPATKSGEEAAETASARFVYKRRDPEDLRERWRRYEFDTQFHDAIIRAYRRDTQPLRDLLNSNTPLSSEHRAELAALIRWGIEPKGRKGRPSGSVPVANPAKENGRRIVDYVRWLKMRKFGHGRLPKGALDALIDEAIKRLNNDDLLEGGANIANIRSELKRGAKKRKP